MDDSKICNKEQSSSGSSPQFQILQQQGTTSPYFMVQNMALSEAHSITSTSSNIEQRHHKTGHNNSTNASSNASATSFSDISMYGQHLANISTEETAPATFIAKAHRLINRNQCNSDVASRSNKPLKFSSSTKKNPIHCVDKDRNVTSFMPDTPCHHVVIKNEGEEIYNHPSASKHTSEHKRNDSTHSNNQSNGSNECNNSLCCSIPTISSSPSWDQKVKRIYL